MGSVHIKHLQKGDILLKEGDASQSMYWVQSGSLRLFKKKGQGFVELGVIHSGEVIGELSFLDHEPRSASVEALQKCEIVEIPRGNFDKIMEGQPPWLTSLIQTLVKRLRTTNNRLREAESNSTVYVQDEEGKTSKIHEFLSTKEILKLTASLVLVATRNSESMPDGTQKVRAGWLQLHAGHILGVQLAKIQSFTEVLQEAGFLKLEKQKDHVDLYVSETDILERFLYWLNEESGKPEGKQTKLSPRALALCDAIYAYGNLEGGGESETFKVNLADVQKKAIAAGTNKGAGIDWNAFDELKALKFADEVRVANENEKFTNINLREFLKSYPMLVLKSRFDILNAKKRGEA